MAENWMRAVAEVFVEVRTQPLTSDEGAAGPHLAAVPDAAPRSAAVSELRLVVVSLLGRPTAAEVRALVEASALAARVIAARDGEVPSRIGVLGLETPRRRRRSPAQIDRVDSEEDLPDVLGQAPQVLIADAVWFHEVPDALLKNSVIIGLVGDEGSEYAQLFVEDTRARLPGATVLVGSVESFAAARNSRRQTARALGEAFVRIVDAQR